MLDQQICFSKHPHPAIDLEKWQKTVELMSEIYDSACGSIVQFRQQEFNVVVTNQCDKNFLEVNSTWPWEMQTFCRRIMETKAPLYVNDAAGSSEWSKSHPVESGPVRSYFGLPIMWPDQSLFGTICVIDTKVSNYNPTLLKLLRQLADLVESDLTHISHYEEIKNLALTDELTSVYNRRGFNAIAKQCIKTAKQLQHNLAIVYFDIDNLKIINDIYGHVVGDFIIKSLGNILQKNFRKTDVISRLGGDEFAVLLLKTSLEDIKNMCERIDIAFNKVIAKHDKSKTTNAMISYGFKIYSANTRLSLTDMIAAADVAMYRHKKTHKK